MNNLINRIINIFIDRLIKYLIDDGIPTVYHYIHDEHAKELVHDNSYTNDLKGHYD